MSHRPLATWPPDPPATRPNCSDEPGCDVGGGARIVLGRFEPVVARGLRSVLGDDPKLLVLASGLEHRELVRALVHLTPNVAIVPRPSDSTALARLTSISSRIAVVVFADRLKPSYVDLLRAVGAACVAYGSDEQQIISAIRQHARRHDVADTPGGHQTVTGPVSGALTEREATIFDLLVEQRTHREIASCLQITPETVRKHAANIRRKLQADAHPPLEMLRAASCGPDT